MPLSTEEIYEKALSMAKNVEDNFLDLGRQLRQLQDREPELFQKIVEQSDLGRRKAYYLVEVSRTFDPLPISRNRLKKIGWTKLQLLAKQITKDNAQELLALAEENTTKQLEKLMRGEKPIDNAHCMLMYFSPKQYKVVEEAMLANGGVKSGRGVVGKEEALVRALKKLKDAPDGSPPAAVMG